MGECSLFVELYLSFETGRNELNKIPQINKAFGGNDSLMSQSAKWFHNPQNEIAIQNLISKIKNANRNKSIISFFNHIKIIFSPFQQQIPHYFLYL